MINFRYFSSSQNLRERITTVKHEHPQAFPARIPLSPSYCFSVPRLLLAQFSDWPFSHQDFAGFTRHMRIPHIPPQHLKQIKGRNNYETPFPGIFSASTFSHAFPSQDETTIYKYLNQAPGNGPRLTRRAQRAA